MLIDKNSEFQDGETIGFKLVTGEEVIGKIVSSDLHQVVVDKPCTLAMGQNGLSLSPASLMADMKHPVTYNRDHIVAWFSLASELEDGYRTATGGIQVPPKGIVVPNSK